MTCSDSDLKQKILQALKEGRLSFDQLQKIEPDRMALTMAINDLQLTHQISSVRQQVVDSSIPVGIRLERFYFLTNDF